MELLTGPSLGDKFTLSLGAMDNEDLLTSLRRDAPALLAAARSAGPGQPIEACPGWTALDLVWHIGEVHFFWGTMVQRRFTDPAQVDPLRPERPADEEGIFAFAEGSASMLIDALSTVDPSTEVWTWSAQHDVAFVVRRMAQETAVHRVDAERAAGNPYRIDAELASDGIDEFFFIHLPVEDAPLEGSGETIHFHQSDGDGEWLAHLTPSGVEVSSGHAKGEAAARGTASDLLLLLWRRLPGSDIETFGNRELLERFLGWMDLG